MIDWKKLIKVAKELKVYPKDCYNPLYLPFDSCSWFDLLSERSLGKTTSFLLLAMIANKEFGTVAEYVRLTKEMIKPKKLVNLFEVIKQFHYIEKITDGRWNDVFYWSGFWYYCNRNEDKVIEEKCQTPFMHVYDLNSTNDLKSAYNNPNGDIIIVDEFIDNQTPYSDFFFYLCDSMSTIFRKRLGCKVFMLANTIDCRSVWFNEQCIMSDVSKMKIGDRKICQRENMTPVYFEIVANSHNSAKQKFVDSYFNFKNPKLNSITGVDTWSYSDYPIYERSHIVDDELKKYEIEYYTRNIFLKSGGFYIQLLPTHHELYGNCVLCRRWEIDPDQDAYILVPDTPLAANEYNFKQLTNLYHTLFCDYYQNRKWYYRDNTTAITVMSFIRQATK